MTINLKSEPDITKEDATLLGCFLLVMGVLGLFASITLAMIYDGWILATLWNWFIIQLGAPTLTTAHAIGISTVADIFLISISRNLHNIWAQIGPVTDEMTMMQKLRLAWKMVFTLFFLPSVVLFIGWIVHRFYM